MKNVEKEKKEEAGEPKRSPRAEAKEEMKEHMQDMNIHPKHSRRPGMHKGY